ncbi:MAG: FAD-binding protein [Ignavibacteriaceae bacterium]|jgi:hypothetical protein
MIKQIEIILTPDNVNNSLELNSAAVKILKTAPEEITAVIVKKRSIDARKAPVFRLICDVYINEQPVGNENKISYRQVSDYRKVLIVGFGPAGMFAALRLLELGIKPIIFERGKDVQSRRKDLRAIQQDHVVNPDSNYCFGEGGAGTYSDGKLYTRSTKRGDVSKILNLFIQHGANADIAIDAHPHIGSNKLPQIVKSIRETILMYGGEIHFNSRVTDFYFKDGNAAGLIINGEIEYFNNSIIIATGHSARDIQYLLHQKNVMLESKPFAMGVRIEHPQRLINEIQYHSKDKIENLPAASYNLSCNLAGRGIYSFCMCPGGIIVPAATSPGEIVVNGMSLSRRDTPYSNAGFVVTVGEEDWKKYESSYPFGGVLFQQELEKSAFELAGKTQSAPAQRVTDFVNKRVSSTLAKSSYIPGLTSAPLHEALPRFMVNGIRQALLFFNNRMKGFYTEEAQLVAVESRTSSPVRIPRIKESYMHPQIKGLFPCGEGAGYAGGIVSSAIDGENCANAAAKYLNN